MKNVVALQVLDRVGEDGEFSSVEQPWLRKGLIPIAHSLHGETGTWIQTFPGASVLELYVIEPTQSQHVFEWICAGDRVTFSDRVPEGLQEELGAEVFLVELVEDTEPDTLITVPLSGTGAALFPPVILTVVTASGRRIVGLSDFFTVVKEYRS